VAGALAANFQNFLKHIRLIFVIVLIHNAFALATGYFFSRLMRLKIRDRKTVSIETGIQNSGLALALIFNPDVFPAELQLGGMAFIAAWWGIWHILAGMGIAFVWAANEKKMKAHG
jgi:bile acid:Na+ symporter, BASS family